jgi:hypothetical protein
LDSDFFSIQMIQAAGNKDNQRKQPPKSEPGFPF